MVTTRTGRIQLLVFFLVLGIVGLAAISSASAVCLATGKNCVLNTASNDRLCCPGMLCGFGNVCQPGCRINGTFYQGQTRNPNNPCQICQPTLSTGSWTNLPSGSACGSQSSTSCDRPDTCNASGTCLANLEPATTVCRPAVAGGCDVEEKCTGSSPTCPLDIVSPATTVCRPAAPGGCDVPENCTGSSPSCPSDGFSTAICRPAAGPCDQAETCQGTGTACPPDGFLTGNVCRPAAGVCDQAETCQGTGTACPADGFLTSECRPSAGGCDEAEDCPGNAPDCPADPCGFESESTTVAVFDNATYVTSSSDNVQAALTSLGHSVYPFTSIAATDITTALAGKQVLLIPEQKLSPAPELKNVLSAAAKTVIRNFVAGGGGLIIHGTTQGLHRFFLNDLFGFSLTGASDFTGSWDLNCAAAVGTAFCGGPASLFAYDHTQVIDPPSLPAGGAFYFYQTFTDHSLLALIPYVSGQIVVIGWDFDDAAPLGSTDDGWLDLLDRAVNQVAQ